MKKVGLSIIFVILLHDVFSQSKTKWSLGASVNPVMCAVINSPGAKDINTDPVYLNNDALKTTESYRLNLLSATGWFNYSLSLLWDLQIGVGYMDLGFQRTQKNLKYNDKIFAGLTSGAGTLQELSGGNGDKNINYDYRFQYIQIPCLISYRIKQSRDFRIIYSLTGGAAVDVLLKHKITANFENFTIDGENSKNIDATGFKSRGVAFNLMVGGRIDFKIEKNLTFMLQPVVSLFPLSVTSGPDYLYPYYLAVHTGLVFEFNK